MQTCALSRRERRHPERPARRGGRPRHSDVAPRERARQRGDTAPPRVHAAASRLGVAEGRRRTQCAQKRGPGGALHSAQVQRPRGKLSGFTAYSRRPRRGWGSPSQDSTLAGPRPVCTRPSLLNHRPLSGHCSASLFFADCNGRACLCRRFGHRSSSLQVLHTPNAMLEVQEANADRSKGKNKQIGKHGWRF